MTIDGFAFERLFSMPTFEGIRVVRARMSADPSLNIGSAIELVRQIEVDTQSLDLDACGSLCELLPAEMPNDGAAFYRGCIRPVLLAYRPTWARSMLQGRSRFYSALERNEQSIFRQAGILDEPPEDDFVEWWDVLTGEIRQLGDSDRMARGRKAEKLTIDHEIERLVRDDIQERPRWIGLDDNTKGYDVLSFEKKDGFIVNRLIEVKSTIASPLRFRVTRNEWDQADRSGDAYLFHIWDLNRDPPALFVRTVEQVRPHIPSDNERGKWKDVEVPVGSN